LILLPTYNTMFGLNRELMRRANIALKNEVKDVVVSKLKEHMQKDVYATYTPHEYQRRMDDGGLIDPKNIEHTVNENMLRVYPTAPIEGPRIPGYEPAPGKTNLAKIIERGARNPWNRKSYRWTKPRPFVKNTQEELRKNPRPIVEALANQVAAGGSPWTLL